MLKSIKGCFIFISLIVCFIFLSCNKQNDFVAPIIPIDPYISLKQDTTAIKFNVTTARKEAIGSISTTTIQGKFADSNTRKNNIVIRVTGDSTKTYSRAEIFATYTDSLGDSFSSSTTDSTNRFTLTTCEKKKNGLVQGNFTIRVSNITKTKILILKEGKFSVSFYD
jgi:hypothetical protein